MRTKPVRKRLAVLICGAILFSLSGCRKRAEESASTEQLARTIVERVHRNLDCNDFAFQLKITRSFPNGNVYSKTFQFYGMLGEPDSKVFAESVSGPPEDGSRYLLFLREGKLVSAQMFSPQFGDIETREKEHDLNKITFGNLSYPEFRHMASLQPTDFDELTETGGYYEVHSQVKERLDDPEESRAVRFVYLIDKESYLPAKIEFFNQHAKFKEFNLEVKEFVQGRWVIRRGKVTDSIDSSETLIELSDFHFDEGVDASVFTEQRLKAQ